MTNNFIYTKPDRKKYFKCSTFGCSREQRLQESLDRTLKIAAKIDPSQVKAGNSNQCLKRKKEDPVLARDEKGRALYNCELC